MSVMGLEVLRARMEALIKKAEKWGKQDGRKDRGGFPREGTALPHYPRLKELCQTVEAELLSSLDQAKSHASSEKDRLDHEIQSLEERSVRTKGLIEELGTKLTSGDAGNESDIELLKIKISQEKAQYEGELERLSDLNGRKNAATNEIVEAERQESQGRRLYSEYEDVVLETYRASYRKSQSKRSILVMIFRRG